MSEITKDIPIQQN